ncbi:MAG: hypothetical protein JNJ71_04155 [Rubrivivax sp.]|nr:hypothetical protein [Rubrivivax sp.]
MKNQLWINPWRKSAQPVRSGRGRRSWHLELASYVSGAPAADEESEGFDGNWFESSRALAQGLRVTEHHASMDVLLKLG